jgi:cell division cycle 2-like protein
MHERGIVHRDIKPENILVGEGGKTLKFCDLGLAMSLATEKTPYEDAGTVPYMAPEMLLGKTDYDARVDTWSLGCVMAEMLSGKRLFNSVAASRGDQIDQLRTIFGVFGLPDDRTWPEFASLPHARKVLRSFQAKENNTLGELFHPGMLSEDGFTVLKGLLECNPDKRLTAAAALQLPWLLPDISTLATPEKKKNVVRLRIKIKNTPPVTTEKKNRATPKKKSVPQINFIPPATPKEKIVLRVPLAMWKSAHLMDPCRC